MKKYFRIILFTVFVLMLLVLCAVTAFAAYDVGGTTYTTLSSAVSAVPDGGVINVVSESTLSSTTLSYDKSYTIYGNGFSLTASGTLTLSAGRMTLDGVCINGSTHVISVSGGELTVLGDSELSTSSGRAIVASGSSKVHLYSGVFR